MDADDQRALAGEALRVGAVEEARHRDAVEAFDLNQLGLDVGPRLEPTRLALRPARQPHITWVERVDVGR